MKVFIIIAILFLSCKDKIATVENSELATTIENNSSELNIDNHNNASDFIRTDVYRGTINGTTKILFYLQEQEHPCGGNLTILDAMYKYENQKNWLLLNITDNKQKRNTVWLKIIFREYCF